MRYVKSLSKKNPVNGNYYFAVTVNDDNVFLSQQGSTKVVFAYHTEDPTSDDNINYHTYRGSKSILLLNSLDKKQVHETDWKEFIIQNKNVSNILNL